MGPACRVPSIREKGTRLGNCAPELAPVVPATVMVAVMTVMVMATTTVTPATMSSVQMVTMMVVVVIVGGDKVAKSMYLSGVRGALPTGA
jgi:hypothetical protein